MLEISDRIGSVTPWRLTVQPHRKQMNDLLFGSFDGFLLRHGCTPIYEKLAPDHSVFFRAHFLLNYKRL